MSLNKSEIVLRTYQDNLGGVKQKVPSSRSEATRRKNSKRYLENIKTLKANLLHLLHLLQAEVGDNYAYMGRKSYI